MKERGNTRYFSVSWKILLSMSLIFGALLVVSLQIWGGIYKDRIQEDAIRNISDMLEISNNVFEKEVQDILNVISMASVYSSAYTGSVENMLIDRELTTEQLIFYKAQVATYLNQLCGSKKYINGITMTNFGDREVSSGATTDSDILLSEYDKKDFEEEQNKVIFCNPRTYAGVTTFAVIRPIVSKEGEMIGAMIAEIRYSLFEDTYVLDGGHRAAVGGSVQYVVDLEEGTVLYASEGAKWNTEEMLARIKECNNTEEGYMEWEEQGMGAVCVYRRSPLSGWTTIRAVRTEELLADYRRSMRQIYKITVCLYLLFIVICYKMVNVLTGNIRRLDQAVKKLGDASLELDIVINSKDEIGALYLQFTDMLNRIKELIESIRRHEREKRQTDLKILQRQINPHFLYNTLNTIKLLAALDGNDNIERVSVGLSELMHVNMDNRAFISLREEKAYLESYLDLQSYHYAAHFEYCITLADEDGAYQIPKILLQPLVENILKHAFDMYSFENKIDITFSPEGGNLVIRIYDNGKGIATDRLEEIFCQKEDDCHIGLYNVRQRIRLYFGPEYDITITGKEGYYTLQTVVTPLIREEEVEGYV